MTSRPPTDPYLRELTQLRRVKDRIDRGYAQPLAVESLAKAVHMSAGHFSRRFKLAYGESPYSYLMTRRIERAMALLRKGDLDVAKVEASGADVVQEPIDQPYGIRDCAFRDPAGNTVRITQQP